VLAAPALRGARAADGPRRRRRLGNRALAKPWFHPHLVDGGLDHRPALREPNLRNARAKLLPQGGDHDIGASPYAISAYEVPHALGGEAGLKKFRERLNARGLKLILDFVPNHVGLDHPWIRERPHLFVHSASEAPETFRHPDPSHALWIAHGKDPHFPAWNDTAQLDYRAAETHATMLETLRSVAALCDGVRCDMSMLLLPEVFAKTWEHLPRGAATHPADFWPTAIQTIKSARPNFAFVAEVYWGLEERLQRLGFDATYNKHLYDTLIYRHHNAAQRHLVERPAAFLNASLHFLENHDEPRILSLLSPAEARASALLLLGLPGWRLLFQGQLDGARLRAPVQLNRYPPEPPQPEIANFYDRLLSRLPKTAVGQGEAQVLTPTPAAPGDASAESVILVQWRLPSGRVDLVVVNLAPTKAQCYAPLNFPGLADRDWQLTDLLSRETVQRRGAELRKPGLYLDLPPHAAQLLHFEPAR